MKFAIISVAIASAALSVVTSAWAQAPQYRDERTGRVWSPVDDDPQTATAYPDAAFDPTEQVTRIPGVVVQKPRARLLGHVPIAAGPGVPLVTLDAPSLEALPGRHWQMILYLSNNSDTTVDAVVSCRFTNGGRTVEHTRVLIPPAGPGERIGMAVRGPRTDLFVDQGRCEVVSPI